MNYGKGMMIARTQIGMSKRQLALKVGVDASFITHIEAGRKRPSLDTIEKVAEVLGMPLPLLMLLSADPSELKGIATDHAGVLGDRLATLVTLLKE